MSECPKCKRLRFLRCHNPGCSDYCMSCDGMECPRCRPGGSGITLGTFVGAGLVSAALWGCTALLFCM